MQTHTIRSGWGYWDVTCFPKGGAFRRAGADLPFQPEKRHGADWYGRLASGERVCVDARAVVENKPADQYPAPRAIPPGKVLIGEAGAADVRDNLAKVETLASAKGTADHMRSLDILLVWSSPGFEVAGSCARWTNGYWAVRWNRDGATYGRRYTNTAEGEADARADYANLTT